MKFNDLDSSLRTGIRFDLRKYNIPYKYDYSTRMAIVTIEHIDKLLEAKENTDAIVCNNARGNGTHTRTHAKKMAIQRLKGIRRSLT